ncbi:hypothetical protein [Anaeromyxobacter paludicola]|uniref:Lipoprotein n=1 Tax=Anaeromyxobacter paludicola TaxID=2918171 RepID=A0ABM7X6H7_9BACT|nr:hypothetical protein [Anaeromyxobacter paludicola]BDG07398.1 hypothetical protein AMPC_05110 [Anaeromyxobacter paludicola]
MRRTKTWPGALAACAAGLLAAGCRPDDGAEAVRLVQRYDAALIEAYKAGDARLVEGLAGERELKKLTGLIGVKLDTGVNMDAELRELKVLEVRREGDVVEVRTEERWHYADRRIGTGAQVGQASDDHYFMRYDLSVEGGRRVVRELHFERPPEVGRTDVELGGDFRLQHGLPPAEAKDPKGRNR